MLCAATTSPSSGFDSLRPACGAPLPRGYIMPAASGASFAWYCRYFSTRRFTATGKAVEGAAWLEKSGLASIPLARIADMLLNPGKVIDFNGDKITYPDIQMIYWVGGNPFVHHQDTNTLIRAWRKPETVVVHDMFWTPTARHADIVLPANTSYERNDIEQGGSYSLRLMTPMRKAVEPLYESRSDFDIFNTLAKALGYGNGFDDGKTEMEWIEGFYDAALTQAKARRIDMPDFDTFWNGDQPLVFEADEEGLNYVRYADFREEPLLEPLGTPSGKIELFSRAIEAMGYDDCPPHPTWMEPVEWQGQADATFPLHLDTAHPKYRLHSQLNSSTSGCAVRPDRKSIILERPCARVCRRGRRPRRRREAAELRVPRARCGEKKTKRHIFTGWPQSP